MQKRKKKKSEKRKLYMSNNMESFQHRGFHYTCKYRRHTQKDRKKEINKLELCTGVTTYIMMIVYRLRHIYIHKKTQYKENANTIMQNLNRVKVMCTVVYCLGFLGRI